MDDFLIFSNDKNYLKKCMKIIEKKLKQEYFLDINEKKTQIIHVKEGFIFLGYKFQLKNQKTICIIRNETFQKIKKKIKKNKVEFDKGILPFEKYFSSLNNYLYSYKYGSKKKIRNYILTHL